MTRYPIYIISKGRWENPLTAKFLLKEHIPFKIAVEPQEFSEYSQVIPKKNIIKLPFSNLGMGSTPARNWCWEHSLERGAKRHFLFDDNINYFTRLNNGKRHLNYNAYEALTTLEKFTDQYLNIGLSGYNYQMFAMKATSKAFVINHHVYSGMLINNELPFRWRLKYNEDIDLCLQILNTKYWCTVYVNTFLISKVSTTVAMKGGNQTELYKGNDHQKKMLKAKSLETIWPQYVKSTYRFGRPHHSVSWGKFFKHPLIRKV